MIDKCLGDKFIILVCHLLFILREVEIKKEEIYFLTTFLKNFFKNRSDFSFLNQLPNHLVDFIVFNTSSNQYNYSNNFYCRYDSEIKRKLKDNMIQYFENFSKPKEKKYIYKFENNYFMKKFVSLKLENKEFFNFIWKIYEGKKQNQKEWILYNIYFIIENEFYELNIFFIFEMTKIPNQIRELKIALNTYLFLIKNLNTNISRLQNEFEKLLKYIYVKKSEEDFKKICRIIIDKAKYLDIFDKIKVYIDRAFTDSFSGSKQFDYKLWEKNFSDLDFHEVDIMIMKIMLNNFFKNCLENKIELKKNKNHIFLNQFKNHKLKKVELEVEEFFCIVFKNTMTDILKNKTFFFLIMILGRIKNFEKHTFENIIIPQLQKIKDKFINFSDIFIFKIGSQILNFIALKKKVSFREMHIIKSLDLTDIIFKIVNLAFNTINFEKKNFQIFKKNFKLLEERYEYILEKLKKKYMKRDINLLEIILKQDILNLIDEYFSLDSIDSNLFKKDKKSDFEKIDLIMEKLDLFKIQIFKKAFFLFLVSFKKIKNFSIFFNDKKEVCLLFAYLKTNKLIPSIKKKKELDIYKSIDSEKIKRHQKINIQTLIDLIHKSKIYCQEIIKRFFEKKTIKKVSQKKDKFEGNKIFFNNLKISQLL